MEKTDILVIGAGVIGLAVARELSSVRIMGTVPAGDCPHYSRKNIIIIEKNKSFGQETSSRNSEVIHGGMYYPSGTLKAELCVNGRHLLYQLCNEKKIPYKKVGKLIIATDKDELSALEALLSQGKINGVKGLQIITEARLKKLEPQVSGIAALYSPETGIIDSHRLMDCLLTAAKENGASVVYNAEVTAIQKNNHGYRVTIKNNAEIVEIKALIVINCAGLDSDIIAGMVGIDILKEKYNLRYCKGQYFRLNSAKARLLKMLVYPVPKPASGGLGVHATIDLAGGVRLGPDDEYLKSRVQDYSVNPLSRLNFYESARKFIPFISEEDLSADTAGIRPKLQEPEGDFRDFVISDEADKGFPGFINLIGIESPGLTAALAIARFVKNIVLNFN